MTVFSALLLGAFSAAALLLVRRGAVVVFGFCGPFSRPALLGVVLDHRGQVRGAGLPTRPGPIRAHERGPVHRMRRRPEPTHSIDEQVYE